MDGVAVAEASVPAVLVQLTFGVSVTAPQGSLLTGWANAELVNVRTDQRAANLKAHLRTGVIGCSIRYRSGCTACCWYRSGCAAIQVFFATSYRALSVAGSPVSI